MRKVMLVTGGSRGIGRACVTELAEAGYAVVFTYYRRRDLAEALVMQLREKGLDAACFPCDMGSAEDVQAFTDTVLRLYHHVDGLVCNAAEAPRDLVGDTTAKSWRRTFAVNMDGVFLLTKALLPTLRDRRGAVVNLSSMWGQVGASCEAAYSASKAALIGWTKALAKEEAPGGIRVNCICPGLIATDMNAHLTEADLAALVEEIPLERIGTPEDVAHAVCFLLSDAAAYITGQVLGVNGGMVM